MKPKSHHHLLHSVLKKLELSGSQSRHSSLNKNNVAEPQHDIFNKLTVKNALSRNTSISVGEKLNLYKTYEDAIKFDKKTLHEEQQKIIFKLSSFKPPACPKKLSSLASRNLMVAKNPSEGWMGLQRKIAFMDKSKHDNQSSSNLKLPFPSLSTMAHSNLSFNTSFNMRRGKKNSRINNSLFFKPNHEHSQSLISLTKEEPNSMNSHEKSTLRRMNLKINGSRIIEPSSTPINRPWQSLKMAIPVENNENSWVLNFDDRKKQRLPRCKIRRMIKKQHLF
jgi:hypothetical protein